MTDEIYYEEMLAELEDYMIGVTDDNVLESLQDLHNEIEDNLNKDANNDR